MKKTLLIVCLILSSISLLAQDGKRVNIGLSIGPSIDWISPKTDNYERDGIGIGLRYGVPVDINFTHGSNYYFSTGIKFEHIGGKMNFPFIYNEKEVALNRKYTAMFLSIPTGIKLKTPTFGSMVFAGNFGFLHGLKLNGKFIDTWVDENGNNVMQNKKEEYENCAFFKESIYVGLGAEYIIQEDFRASFYINYAYTITNFFNKKAINPTTNLREKGNPGAVEFVFGIHF
ncbi:PorT family protein [Bacteroidales bacterium OttesenSCG-928-B11]|nr:PorT family protein [Bacteroidales bacterium OttesenSCG-928-E04]MDL2308467.1 PorT family protein [Bacteroidales bacterium OttesenSCG-928-C03]MDL2311448.1 PorT family protein [Bacteroidales bacterium OttesenSCG-928-B11]